MKRFCIIAIDYEKSVPRQGRPSISEGLLSLKNQTYQDFCVVLCHDGPKTKTYQEEGIEIAENTLTINTPTRNQCWGHHSRDFAMRYAYEHGLGQYYVQFNVDNILYRDALEVLSQINAPIIVFKIIHWKISHKEARDKGWIILSNGGVIVPGNSAKVARIDCLQLSATKDIWKSNNFWNKFTYDGDGLIYEKLCGDEGSVVAYVNTVLGENF